MDNSTYCQNIRDIILKRARDYYYNNLEAIKKNMRDEYKNLSEEETKRNEKLSKKKL